MGLQKMRRNIFAKAKYLAEHTTLISETNYSITLKVGKFNVVAKYQNVRASVSFAPMTKLTMAKEFESLQENEMAKALNLESHLEALCPQIMRFYIGNRDTRIGTDRCFQLVESLANAAFEQNLRSPPIEMIVSPSIGHMGHGTSKVTFESGADWLGKQLGTLR